MYDHDHLDLFGRSSSLDSPYESPYVSSYDDGRLRLLAYVDGRLVDSWTEPVRGSRWQHVADRFDDDRQPPRVFPSLPAPPRHEEVLRWLDGMVGGREALLALTDDATATPTAPTFGDTAAQAAYAAVQEHLDRVAGEFLDADAQRVLAHSLALLWDAAPHAVTQARSAPTVAGGLIWIVGKANGLFAGGLTQQLIRRELWLKQALNLPGQALARHLRGIDFHSEPRPRGCPDLTSFARPELLTVDTRRRLIQWRDLALALDDALLTPGAVLPSEVES